MFQVFYKYFHLIFRKLLQFFAVSPFYRWGNWRTDRLGGLPKVTHEIRAETGVKAGSLASWPVPFTTCYTVSSHGITFLSHLYRFRKTTITTSGNIPTINKGCIFNLHRSCDGKNKDSPTKRPHPNPQNLWTRYLMWQKKGLCSCDEVKDLTMERLSMWIGPG